MHVILYALLAAVGIVVIGIVVAFLVAGILIRDTLREHWGKRS